MENKDKNIFHPLARMIIPDQYGDKNHYCAHHEDFGHLTNDYRNIYGQIMFTIKKGRLMQYVKKTVMPKMTDQTNSVSLQKGKEVAEQRTLVAEQRTPAVE